jgi:phosphoglycerate dehydrogenase-like enzyme
VVSGWAVNAVPVAEFTLGQILLAGKVYFRNVREYNGGPSYSFAFRGRGNFEQTVSILGAGQIGRLLIALLRPFHLRVIVFDPFLSHKNAETLGVEKVSLEDAFSLGNVISNHLADVPETKRMLDGRLFASLPQDATFINTGRGATVAQPELIAVMRTRPDLTALLDVTDPEPLPSDSPLLRLANVQVSSHIAGAIGGEVGRIAATVLEEFDAWCEDRPLRCAVTPLMLQTMA